MCVCVCVCVSVCEWVGACSTHTCFVTPHTHTHTSDFLLILLRDVLVRRPTLRVVLMSASMHAELFSEYFGNCPRIHIPGYTYSVDSAYLEDILRIIESDSTESLTTLKAAHAGEVRG